MIKIETLVNAPINTVWSAWTKPEHITQWNFASDDWHCPKAENDVRKNGKFSSTMAAKDGSFSFDFGGTHANVEEFKFIESVMGDGRKMKVTFIQDGSNTKVIEEFEPESQHPVDFQKAGWQSILDNFKKYTETT
jgi:uncharacterized protein YndB with AHSA1/START domain